MLTLSRFIHFFSSARLSKLRLRDILALILCLAIFFYVTIPFTIGERNLESFFRPRFTQNFDPQLWRASGIAFVGNHRALSPTYGQRYKIVDSLLASKTLIGLNENQLTNLLGPPDAGVVDKKVIQDIQHLTGSTLTKTEREILDYPGDLAIWSYHLAYQHDYPATSFWFPFPFYNFDGWKLLIKLRDGKVIAAKVSY